MSKQERKDAGRRKGDRRKKQSPINHDRREKKERRSGEDHREE